MNRHQRSLELLDKFISETSEEDMEKIIAGLDKEVKSTKRKLVATIVATIMVLSGYGFIWYLFGWQLMTCVALINWGQNIALKYANT